VEGLWGSATRETLPRQLTINEFSKKNHNMSDKLLTD